MGKHKFSFTTLAVLTTAIVSAQQASVKSQLEKALTEKKYALADSLLQNRLRYFISNGKLDSLSSYTTYIGRVEEKRSNTETAIRKIQDFIEQVKTYRAGTKTLSKVYTEAGEYYGSIGKYEQAYKLNQQAYSLALQTKGIDPAFLASIDSDMGTFAFRKGDVALAEHHNRKAIKVFLASKTPEYESLYTAANNMGSQMWFSSKMDSSIYFFDIAMNALRKTEYTPINQYYRPAVLQNNLAALYNMQGQTKKAIDAMKACIENLRIYLSIPETVPKKPNAVSFQFEAIDNLGGIYKELGDYSQALSLETYSYQKKQKYGGDDPAGVFKSQILLGQLHYAMRAHTKALQFLNSGLSNITKVDGDYLFWQADACNTLALLHDAQGDIKKAAFYYEKADSLYEASLQGEYDDIYLEFLRNASLFYSENYQLPLALSKANKGFTYVKRTQGDQTLLAFYQLMNLAEVHLNAGQHTQSLKYSQQGLAVVNNIIKTSNHLLDSIKIELKKPKAVLLKTKANYGLIKNKSAEQLTSLLKELNDALSILERRKTVILDSKDIGLMMEDQMELIQFIKQLTQELYTLTKNKGYIDQLLSLQESATYSRIRSRLEQSDSIRFAHLPLQVQEKEKSLKAAITASLENNTPGNKNMDRYFSALDQWNAFQQKIKSQYPDYYKMRYESIFQSLGNVQQSIPSNATVVRYFFIDKHLFAVVLDNQQKTLVALQSDDIDRHVKEVSDYTADLPTVTNALHQLYNQLWAPLLPYINNTKLILIPDGILFNLNFEILTRKRIKSYEELASASLLSNYTISYHYTLALAGKKSKSSKLNGEFVAFAPGFLDQQKKHYLKAVKDSFQLDQSYITLLPQPFTVAFVSKAKQLFGGEAYINNESTTSSFKKFAGNHKIIHIGTHAESNNISPEYSRLIFSKNVNSEPNSLYLHEIYNCDLRSELAVLTACESGRPGYQDGEGMISLAHAFNYAGSESMVNGLWKIDEKTSTVLMESFYNNLLAGMDKDEALRQAKLLYLKTARGRELSPQYWAGLVLMGDTSPIELKKEKSSIVWWVIGGAAIALTIIGLAMKKRKQQINL